MKLGIGLRDGLFKIYNSQIRSGGGRRLSVVDS